MTVRFSLRNKQNGALKQAEEISTRPVAFINLEGNENVLPNYTVDMIVNIIETYRAIK